jgi:hypothetical protein
MKRIAFVLVCLVACIHSAVALEPPPLEKFDAKKIMEAMEWTEVTVITVRQGVDARGAVAPIYATVVGLGKLHGEHHSICQTLYYDKDLDWHFLELRDRSAHLWNKNGCQEIKPWGLW